METPAQDNNGGKGRYSPADELEFSGQLEATALDIVMYAANWEEMGPTEARNIIVNYMERELQGRLELPPAAELQDDARQWAKLQDQALADRLLRQKLLNKMQYEEIGAILGLMQKAGDDPDRMAELTDGYLRRLERDERFGCDERDMVLGAAIACKYLYAYWFDALLNPMHPIRDRLQPDNSHMTAAVKAGLCGFFALSGGQASLLEDGIAGAALYSLLALMEQ